MDTFWLNLAIFFLGVMIGCYLGKEYESQDQKMRSIPPSESLDTLKRMNKIASGKEDGGVYHSLRNTRHQPYQIKSELDERVKFRSAKKLHKSRHPEGDERWMPKYSVDTSNALKPQGKESY